MESKIICGIDEAGRGPLAGPVTAGCVILPADFPLELLDDSKKLSPKRREEAFQLIVKTCVHGLGWVWPSKIDEINIHHASLLAMQLAYESMGSRADKALIDGKFVPPGLAIPGQAFVKGDSLYPCISAASILAKVARDRWMVRYSWIEPDYAFEIHKGYPTALHRTLLEQKGPSVIHRKTFHWKKASPTLLLSP